MLCFRLKTNGDYLTDMDILCVVKNNDYLGGKGIINL